MIPRGGLRIREATKRGYRTAYPGDGCLPTWKGARGAVQKGQIPTILCDSDTIGVVESHELT